MDGWEAALYALAILTHSDLKQTLPSIVGGQSSRRSSTGVTGVVNFYVCLADRGHGRVL